MLCMHAGNRTSQPSVRQHSGVVIDGAFRVTAKRSAPSIAGVKLGTIYLPARLRRLSSVPACLLLLNLTEPSPDTPCLRAVLTHVLQGYLQVDAPAAKPQHSYTEMDEAAVIKAKSATDWSGMPEPVGASPGQAALNQGWEVDRTKIKQVRVETGD